MPFSLALLGVVVLVEYLAYQKEQQKRRCTQSMFGSHECTSSRQAIK